MSFVADNDAFETWLRTQCDVVEDDLDYKHKRMCKSTFIFLRATYFRWATQIPTLLPNLMNAPKVLCVGDAHTENFGTWRDSEGRLVWGVNDFDDAAVMPYALDLVRLATSVRLADSDKYSQREAAEAIAQGYAGGLAEPRPTLLDEKQQWMREYVACTDEERLHFMTEVDEYPDAQPPASVQDGLRKSLPSDAEIIRYSSRRKGGGGLGRPRYVAVAFWNGGKIVREAKALVPSAWEWARGNISAKPKFLELAKQKYRAPDPFLDTDDGFVYRRIAADSRKVELGQPPKFTLALRVLKAMGFELGAIHAADTNSPAAKEHFVSRPPGWLHESAKTAAAALDRDYQKWRAHCGK